MIPRLLPILLAMVVSSAGLCGPASATTVSANVAFSKTHQNPWQPGNAFSEAWTYDDLQASFNLRLPTIGASPTQLLSQAIGLPEIGFARVGGNLQGSVGLELGYAVSGGRMNITYPGHGEVDFATLGNSNRVAAGRAVVTGSSFTPGLRRVMTSGGIDLGVLGGAGYGPTAALPGFSFDTFQNPRFQTAFPNAAAWATLNVNLNAGLFAEAGLLRVGDTCIGCAGRTWNRPFDASVEIVNVNRNGVQVLDQVRVPLFDQTIGLGSAALRVSYPDVAVSGQLQADGRTVAGSGSRRMLEVIGNIEQLVPVLGPFLNQQIGPFNAKLLGIEGGPTFSLYQDFRLDVNPRVALVFDRGVLATVNGVPTVTQVVTGRLGDRLDWTPLIGSASTDLKVQTIFLPEATITNHTGFSLGYQVDIDALRVALGGLALGPIDVADLANDLALKLPPIFSDTFDFNMAPIVLGPKTLQVGGVLAAAFAERSFFVGSVTEQSPGLFRVSVLDDRGFTVGSADVTGHLQTLLDPFSDSPQRIFIADAPILVDALVCSDGCDRGTVDLGTHLCLVCRANDRVFAPESASFFDDGEQLFINDLSDFALVDTEFEGDPRLNRQTGVRVFDDRVVEGDRYAIDTWDAATPLPVPATWALVLAALALGGFARRPRS